MLKIWNGAGDVVGLLGRFVAVINENHVGSGAVFGFHAADTEDGEGGSIADEGAACAIADFNFAVVKGMVCAGEGGLGKIGRKVRFELDGNKHIRRG